MINNINQYIYICGVFDLLHAGHFNLIYRAKNLFPESYITIGLCSDKLASKTKRKPIHNEKIRKKNLLLLDLIDKVIIYNDLDQTKILNKIKPNILVIPPDYGKCEQHKKTIEAAQSQQIYCIIIPRTKKISTTELINQ